MPELGLDDGPFATPDWDAPLDVEAIVAATPADGVTRGLHLHALEGDLQKVGAATGKDYALLHNYSMREYIRLLARTAAALYPKLHLRRALRRVGESIYTQFSATLVGKAIFTVARNNFRAVAKLAPKAYAASYSPGYVEVESQGKGDLEVRLREIWPFADSLQVGVWEGSMRACGAIGTIEVRRLSTCNVDFRVRWDE